MNASSILTLSKVNSKIPKKNSLPLLLKHNRIRIRISKRPTTFSKDTNSILTVWFFPSRVHGVAVEKTKYDNIIVDKVTIYFYFTLYRMGNEQRPLETPQPYLKESSLPPKTPSKLKDSNLKNSSVKSSKVKKDTP